MGIIKWLFSFGKPDPKKITVQKTVKIQLYSLDKLYKSLNTYTDAGARIIIVNVWRSEHCAIDEYLLSGVIVYEYEKYEEV